MKKIALIDSDIKDTITKYFENKDVEFVEEIQDGCDLIVLNDADDDKILQASQNNSVKVINVHPSLLPAFEGKNAIEKAFMAGVKVSGVTLYDKDKIIAQYPVLIGVDTHIDEFKQDIIDIQKRLVPVVIDSIINDTVFDFTDLFKSPCHHVTGGCSGCGKCS